MKIKSSLVALNGGEVHVCTYRLSFVEILRKQTISKNTGDFRVYIFLAISLVGSMAEMKTRDYKRHRQFSRFVFYYVLLYSEINCVCRILHQHSELPTMEHFKLYLRGY